MVKIKRKKVKLILNKEIESHNLVLKGVVSDAIKVKNTLDTIGCYQHILPVGSPLPLSSNFSKS